MPLTLFRTIRARMSLLFGLLLIGLFYYTISSVMTEWREVREFKQLAAIEQVSVSASALIHELQRERGVSAGFIGSKGGKFADELVKQRQATDSRRKELEELIRNIGVAVLPAAIGSGLREGLGAVLAGDSKRQQISALTLSGPESFAHYSEAIDRFLVVLGSATASATEAETAKMAMTYVMFINAKEQAGRERATLNAVFTADKPIEPVLYRRLLTILTAQDTYLKTFRSLAGAPRNSAFDKLLGETHSVDTERMRRTALDKASAGEFGVEPAQWFATITAKIDAMKVFEDQIAKDLAQRVDNLEASALRRIVVASTAMALLIVVAVLFGVLLTSTLRAVNQASQVAAHLAEGDLTVSVDTRRQDEIGELLQALSHTVGNLAQTIGNVSATADELNNAAGQVSETAQSLAQSSSEQAASVEETTASIEQMTASINRNTDSAKVTDGMASKSALEAAEGGAVVSETVAAMKQIAGKIGIIDEIAYQTNLLALNAAIEAARAGEHGKGFAVVAAEVRKLAERSQVAAQEIGELAGSSVKTAERAGELLKEMVPAIRKTSELVQEIASASQEQSTGVGQINSAMGQLNKATQMNASASEELAATAEEMGGQARSLQDMMAFFKVA